MPRGISRHVVRFIRAQNQIFAIKEATDRFVLREHRLLHELAERGVPAVDAFGIVVDRTAPDGEELGGLLITRHLPFSLPYRSLFTGRGLPDLRARLLDSLAELFVRLHLAGFYWGDCSLSNTLFRRDAGALAAYLVDAETGELHDRLSPGQRNYDITIATENIAGELFDLQASGNFAEDVDPVETAMALAPQYENLWAELTSDEIVGRDESYRIDHRIKRLNRLGFDVSELEISSVDSGSKLRFHTQVVDPGHHQRRLFELTGLRVQENQARSLLADLARFRAKWAEGWAAKSGRIWPPDAGWTRSSTARSTKCRPSCGASFPTRSCSMRSTSIGGFCPRLAEQMSVGMRPFSSYVENVLRFVPEAKVEVLTGPVTEEIPAIVD